ncbi:cytochrome P450 [Lipomyces orientalis]|uniref:Cytochrome P450 n=1 Tax=Lipomyces orientalis TaxID=1233043 RepID=A0ACC3TEN7_9ASCO
MFLEFVATGIAITGGWLILQHLLLSATQDEPPLAKGPFPFLGFALAFVRNPQTLLLGLQEKYGWVFTIYMAGDRVTVLTDTSFGIPQAFSKRSLSFLHFQRKFSQTLFGYTKSFAMDLELQKRLVHKISNVLGSKPLSADITQTLKTTYLSLIDDSSRYARCAGQVVDLYDYCRDNMFYASARALFGPEFSVDQIYRPFILFEEHFPKFARGYPGFLNREGCRAQHEVLDKLGTFFIDPSRVAKSSLLIRSLYDILMDGDHKSSADIAGFFFSILIGSKSNSVPGAFWMLSNIVADVELKAEIEEIIAKQYDAVTGEFDWTALLQNPLISSCFKETMRLNGNTMPARQVMEDITLKVASRSNGDARDVLFRKGSSIVMPGNIVHWNPDVYPDPMKWMGKRFLEENQGVLIQGGSTRRAYIPWGGGADMCPGRHLALLEAVIQLVYTLVRFDIEPIEPLPAPLLEGRYITGMLRPEKSYRVKLTRRKMPLVPLSA